VTYSDDLVDLGTEEERSEWLLRHVTYRCREHPDVASRQLDRCYCGQELLPVVPTGLKFITWDDLNWLYDQRTERERRRRGTK
jgi:hypothetical protein